MEADDELGVGAELVVGDGDFADLSGRAEVFVGPAIDVVVPGEFHAVFLYPLDDAWCAVEGDRCADEIHFACGELACEGLEHGAHAATRRLAHIEHPGVRRAEGVGEVGVAAAVSGIGAETATVDD